MLSWVKDALASVKSKGKTHSEIDEREEVDRAEDCLNLLKEEKHKPNNNDYILQLLFPTPPPSASPSAPPPSHHSPLPPPSLSTRLSGTSTLQPPCVSPAPPPCSQPSVSTLQPPCVSPAPPPCSQPPAPCSTQPMPPSDMPFLSLLDPLASLNTSNNSLPIPKREMPLGSQQSLQVLGKDSSVKQENQGENTLQAAAGIVLAPTIDKRSYPSCFMTTALTGQIGQLVTEQDEKYVLVRTKGKMLKVFLNGNQCDIPPCRLVWRAAQPVPLVELSDSTFVEIDAVVCPKSKKLHAAVVWQDTKPSRCPQLLDNTYLFLDSRSVTCWPKFEDVIARKLIVLFDGAIVSAEVCDAVVFIGQAKATLAELLQHNLEQCNATVYKVLEGTGGGRVLYVCTCLWVGQKPLSSSLPMVINRRMFYAKEDHGLYTTIEKKKNITLCLDMDASLCVTGDTATLQVALDGSMRSLKATAPLGLEPGCWEAGETTQVCVHVRMEKLMKLMAFSAVMIKSPDSAVLDTNLNEMSTRDLLSKAAPHCPSGFKDIMIEVCKSDSAGDSADGQQARVSSSLKDSDQVVRKASSVPTAQNTPIAAAQNTPTLGVQNTPATAAQNTPTTAAQNTPTTAAQNTPTTAAQKTKGTASQKGDVPLAPKASGTAAQMTSGTASETTPGTAVPKTPGKARKNKRKSASLSQLSSTGQQWDYLTCGVLKADSCVAVAMGAGKKILVTRADLFVNGAPLEKNDNVASKLKKVQNIGVIYTLSPEVHQVHEHWVDLVTVAAWAGKKPNVINNDYIEERLSVLKKVAAPKVTPAPTAAPRVTPAPTVAPKMSPAPTAAPKVTPAPTTVPTPAVPLPAGTTTVHAVCMITKVIKDNSVLLVRSKYLPGNCGTSHARLCNMYLNGTPMTPSEVNVKERAWWHCELEIKKEGKHLKVPVAWRGKKPGSNRAQTMESPHQRQSLSTGDLTNTSSSPPGTASFIQPDGRQMPPLLPPKLLKGTVTELLAEGGTIRGEDGRHYPFSYDACFLFEVCLRQIERSDVLQVGMTVEFEVAERSRGTGRDGAEAAVQRVWVEGEYASLALMPTDVTIDLWCNEYGISSATREALKQEAELLSPNLFPTALETEAITTIDVTS